MNTDLAAQRALDRLAAGGLMSLDGTDRLILSVWLFEGQVENGGFARFFTGRYGDFAALAPNALREIGADEMAELAEEANGVFGPGGPPADREARRAAVEALPPAAQEALRRLEDRFFASSEDIDALLEAHLSAAA